MDSDEMFGLPRAIGIIISKDFKKGKIKTAEEIFESRGGHIRETAVDRDPARHALYPDPGAAALLVEAPVVAVASLEAHERPRWHAPVSYTHLTLPTN